MNGSFTGLFDTGKYRFNYLAGLAYLAGGFISWLLWWIWRSLETFIRFGRFHFYMDAKYLAFTILAALVGAVAFIGLAHVLKKDILLPILAGLAMVLWGFFVRSVRLILYRPTFDIPSIVMNFLWMFLAAAGVIIFYRILGKKPSAFILGFASGEFLGTILATVLYHNSIRYLLEGLILNTGSGALTGLLFYAAMASHLQWKQLAVTQPEDKTKEPLTELPAAPRFLSKRNFSIGWSFQWRMALAGLATFAVLSAFLAFLPEPIRRILFFERSRLDAGGGMQFVTYGFIGAPVITLFFVNWISKAVLRVRYRLDIRRFIGWSVWWRILLINLAGLLPLMIIAVLIPAVAGSRMGDSWAAALGLSVILYFIAWIFYVFYVIGWVIHYLFKLHPLERWTRWAPRPLQT